MSIHPTQLFSLLYHQGDATRLSQAIAKAEPQMLSAGEKNLWLFWKGQASLLSDQLDDAEALIAQITDAEQAERLRQLVLLARSKKTGNFEQLIAHLERSVRDKDDSLNLLQLCECYYETKNWKGIAAHAKSLVEKIGTAASLHLAAEGAFAAGEIRLCLELLDGKENLFPSGKLPINLRRLQIHCWRNEGHLHLAREEAEKLMAETQASADLLTIVGLQIESGDLKGAASQSRLLLTRTDVQPLQHLRLARAFQLDDPTIAGAHLDRALASGDQSPEFAVEALELIFRLNREKAFPELQAALMQSAQSGGKLQPVSPDQLIEMLRAQSESASHAQDLYREGRIPLHFLAEMIRSTLGGIYQSYFDPPNTTNGMVPTAPIFIRHGGRQPSPPASPIQHLYIDISALLIAHKLDLLDVVAQKLGPCSLPSHAIESLYYELERAHQHQPSQMEVARVVSELVRGSRISVMPEVSFEASLSDRAVPSPDWQSAMKMAQNMNGYLVTFLPTTTGFPPKLVELTPDEKARTIDTSTVFKAMEMAGKLTATELTDLQSRGLFRSPEGVEEARLIPPGTNLFVHGNLPGVLAGSGVLPKICSQFKIWIEASEIQRIDAALDNEKQRAELRSNLQALRNKLQSGLSSSWILLPSSPDEPERHSPEASCILDLARLVASPGAFVWVDDRFLNGFAHCGSIPTISTYELLRYLHRVGALDDFGLFSRLHLLRVANFRHLPIEADEIVHHLKAASIRDKSIVETPELTSLRRYLANCLLGRENLQMPPVAEGLPNPAGELGFVMGIFEASRQSLVKIWSEVSSDNLPTIVAKADWIVQSLWYDVGVLTWLTKQEATPAVNAAINGTVAPLYAQGLSLIGRIAGQNQDRETKRALYFRWLSQRFASDEATIKAVAESLRQVFVSDKLEQIEGEVEQRAYRNVLTRFFADLPPDIQDSLNLPADTLKELRITQRRSIKIENWTFETDAFWQAASVAAKSGSTQIATSDGANTFQIAYSSTPPEPPVISLSRVGVNDDLRLSDPLFLLLSEVPEVWRETLLSHSEWFDSPASSFRAQVDSIAQTTDVSERIRLTEQQREHSAQWYYQELRNRRDQGQTIHLSNLNPPSAPALLNHLRLESSVEGKSLFSQLNEAAAALVSETGFSEAFRRFSKLPIILPSKLVEAFLTMPKSQQTEWSNTTYEQTQSVLGKLHVIGLLLRVDRARALDLTATIATENAYSDVEALASILHWLQKLFEQREDSKDWSASTLLMMTWLHAGHLYEILTPNSTSEAVGDFFTKASPVTSFDLFRVRDELTNDICNARRVEGNTLILQALVAYTEGLSFSAEEVNQLQPTVHSLCFDSTGDRPLVKLELLPQPQWLGDCLGSFLHIDRAAFLGRFLGEETSQLLSSEWIINLTRASIAAVTEKPDGHLTEWNLLHRVLNTAPPPSSLKDALHELLFTDRIPSLETLTSRDLRVILYFLSQQSVYVEGATAKIGEKILTIAKLLSGKTLDAKTMQFCALTLMECSNQVGSAEPTSQARALVFARNIQMIIEVWPASVEPIWGAVSRFFSRVPASVGLSLWPLVLELRSKSEKSPEELKRDEAEGSHDDEGS